MVCAGLPKQKISENLQPGSGNIPDKSRALPIGRNPDRVELTRMKIQNMQSATALDADQVLVRRDFEEFGVAYEFISISPTRLGHDEHRRFAPPTLVAFNRGAEQPEGCPAVKPPAEKETKGKSCKIQTKNNGAGGSRNGRPRSEGRKNCAGKARKSKGVAMNNGDATRNNSGSVSGGSPAGGERRRNGGHDEPLTGHLQDGR
jgi:hypothetical protein